MRANSYFSHPKHTLQFCIKIKPLWLFIILIVTFKMSIDLGKERCLSLLHALKGPAYHKHWRLSFFVCVSLWKCFLIFWQSLITLKHWKEMCELNKVLLKRFGSESAPGCECGCVWQDSFDLGKFSCFRFKLATKICYNVWPNR